ncbi:MAG: thiamine diphosphokinase [Acidobacteriota bacterium]|nr:thiamine diphosphokinase [Acidobacteriota bacterium]MDQ7088692.1 thiamine diphosphokinase [Acidobacteriota bacterium]
MRVVIVGAAPDPGPTGADACAAADLVIAADGGAAHCLGWGLSPRVVIGDNDSLATEAAARLERRGTRFLRYPPEKDATDLELALDEALDRGAESIDLFGVLGGRWDHTLANLLLPARPKYAPARIRAWADDQWLHWLHPGRELRVHGRPGLRVSLLPLGGDAREVVTRGLRFPLAGETLDHARSRGVSNAMTGRQATVRLGGGVLVVIGPPGGQKPAET